MVNEESSPNVSWGLGVKSGLTLLLLQHTSLNTSAATYSGTPLRCKVLLNRVFGILLELKREKMLALKSMAKQPINIANATLHLSVCGNRFMKQLMWACIDIANHVCIYKLWQTDKEISETVCINVTTHPQQTYECCTAVNGNVDVNYSWLLIGWHVVDMSLLHKYRD